MPRLGILSLLALLAVAEEKPEIVRLHTGLRFTEGPAADAKGNVYFTDIPNERILRVDTEERKLTVFREASGRANGLMFNAKGELVACEGGNGRVTAIARDGKTVRIIAAEFGGKPFNSPNDLVIDRQGGVYFTDPHFGRPRELPQEVMAVYYVAPDGKVARLVSDLKRPNGVILSPDEKTLYVVPSGQAEVMAYPVLAPGKLGKGRVFARLEQPPRFKDTGGDGLTVDTDGNLYITSRLGIQVYSEKGDYVRLIAVPEVPANVTFGGKERKTLYITARRSLYTLRVDAKGHVFPAGKR